jgi:hypothetical protein
MPDGQGKEKKMKRHKSFILLTAVVIMAFLGTLGCGLLPTPEAEVEIQFWASEEIVAPGGCTVLHWEVEGGEGAPVFLDGEEVVASGEEMVCVEQATTFELTVGASGGPYKESVTVHVAGTPGAEPTTSPAGPLPTTPTTTGVQATATRVPPTATRVPPTATSQPPPPQAPKITYFRADGTDGSITVNSGTTVTLSWEWERVSEGYLDPGNIPMICPAMPCTYQVSPTANTTYTLRAVNPSGTDSKTVTVNVTTAPTTLTFTFSPTSGPVASEVELYLSAPIPVEVYYEGRVLPKVVTDGGMTLRVTIPADATSGYFELRWDGQSVRASEQFTISRQAPPSATLILHNNTGAGICWVYFSPPAEGWGDDRLGPTETVSAGQTRSWGIAEGTWDLKAVGCNDQEYIESRVNISGTYFWEVP